MSKIEAIEQTIIHICERKGNVDRQFFESDELKTSTFETIEQIYRIIQTEAYNIQVDEFNRLFPIVIRNVRTKITTRINPCVVLQNNANANTWLTEEKKTELSWNVDDIKTYRGRYFRYLSETLNRPISVINETRKSSLEILERLGDTNNAAPFFVKGLVVGSVQSGKTGNFNAVINSAIDLKYGLIIVLSGIMEDLRRQTQIRLESDVEGKWLNGENFNGVGQIASFGNNGHFPDVHQASIFTSRLIDFRRHVADLNLNLGGNINILVCKKNTSILKNLILWFNEHVTPGESQLDIPLLIVDDEADNASLNNIGHRGAEYASTINGHIRALLQLFKRKTFLGYTASPFANILQDLNEEVQDQWQIRDTRANQNRLFSQVGNLFPEDFIVLLNPPSNYIGPKNFFETSFDDIQKIEPLIAEPITDYYFQFPERVNRFTNFPVRFFATKEKFDNNQNAIAEFSTFRDYKNTTRSTTQNDNFPIELPNSLKEAVQCYILSIALRLSRRNEMPAGTYNKHNSMLIHISRYSAWQVRTKELIITYITHLQDRINHEQVTAIRSVYGELELIWNRYLHNSVNTIHNYLPAEYDDPHLTPRNYEEIRNWLPTAIRDIEVKAVNTLAKDKLDYEDKERKYIVVGGNKLSRGFTLEGLTVNYFLRNTNYADTLLQMGRWFGYRPGYLDGCKLFTTQDTIDKFNEITAVIEELEGEIEKLANSGDRPIDYALKVMTSRSTLKLTRPGILKNADIIQWSFQDKLLQTSEFQINQQNLTNSWASLKNFYAVHQFEDDNNRGFLKKYISSQDIIHFLNSQENFTRRFEKDAIVDFIERCNGQHLLENWTIAIKTRGASNRFLEINETQFSSRIQMVKRSGPDIGTKFYDLLFNQMIFRASGASSNIVTSPEDLAISLSNDDKERAKQSFINLNGKNPPESIYRRKIPQTEGVLIIYLIDLMEVFNSDRLRTKAIDEGIDLNTPLVGFAIGVPPFENQFEGERYAVNRRVLQLIDEKAQAAMQEMEDEIILVTDDDEEIAGIEEEDID
jgi:hypothetical protein